jgi:hypothetical protein
MTTITAAFRLMRQGRRDSIMMAVRNELFLMNLSIVAVIYVYDNQVCLFVSTILSSERQSLLIFLGKP